MVNKKRGKKAQGHLELILSFVIFVGFTFAIFIFLNPLKQPHINYASLDDLEKSLLNYTSISYKEIMLGINQSFDFDSLVSLKINYPFNPRTVLAKNITDEIINAKIEGNYMIFQNSENSRFYTIFVSPFFNNFTSVECLNNPNKCQTLVTSNASFGAVTYETIPLYENFFELNKSYMSDYVNLVKNLGIEGKFEFALYNFPQKTVIINDSLSKFKIKSSNVLSRDILLKTIDKNATQHDVILNIKIWE
jgi:hypothetical protein